MHSHILQGFHVCMMVCPVSTFMILSTPIVMSRVLALLSVHSCGQRVLRDVCTPASRLSPLPLCFVLSVLDTLLLMPLHVTNVMGPHQTVNMMAVSVVVSAPSPPSC